MATRARNEPDLGLLVERYRQGDRSAIGELVNRESESLGKWLKKKMPPRILRSVGLSDIIQQTAVELLSIQPRFENRGSVAFRSLLRTIAGRVLTRTIRHAERQKRDPRQQIMVSPAHSGGLAHSERHTCAERLVRSAAGHAETPSGLAMRRERIVGVKQCFASLAASDRQIIRLVDYEHLDYAGAASALGITNQAARKRHSRAVARLRRRIEEAGISSQ